MEGNLADSDMLHDARASATLVAVYASIDDILRHSRGYNGGNRVIAI